MNIYITTQGARIIREGRHLLVKKGEDTYHTLFVEKIKQLVLFGNIALTPSARNTLLSHNVDTVFCRKDGRYVGRFANPAPKNVSLRKRQFNLLDDENFAVSFCRSIVKGKLTNMATLLMRINRTRKNKHASRLVRRPPTNRYGLLADLDCTATFDLPLREWQTPRMKRRWKNRQVSCR